jgi:hypothetical protein
MTADVDLTISVLRLVAGWVTARAALDLRCVAGQPSWNTERMQKDEMQKMQKCRNVNGEMVKCRNADA